MTRAEKKKFPSHKTTGGCLRTYTYKEAWKKVPKEQLKKIKQLKNFDMKKLTEITGIKRI